jgi:CubicO group peptidase (beta-lactamase class C family)
MHPKFPQTEFEAFIQETLEIWQVPSASVAVIQDGQVILCQGYGIRNLIENLPANAQTLYPIASCTKAFTAMCLALLVEEGQLEWDKPLQEYLPAFKLWDPHATGLFTPRDLLCHRSGLPRHDLVWYLSKLTRQEVFDRLAYLEPNSSFRSAFYYQNMMYMVAGLLVENLTGLTWETFVKQNIFDKLGMKRSNTSTKATQHDPNHAQPYRYRKGNLDEIPFYEQGESDCVGPAGTICSCVEEMATWLAVHLNGGQHNEQSFISANNLAEMHKPYIFIDDPQARQRFGHEFNSYGLGWFLSSFKGQVLIRHGGNIDGFSSLTSFMPQHNLGVIVLTNGDGEHNSSPSTISYTIYDRLLGLEATDWNSKMKAYNDELLAAGDKSKEQAAEQQNPVSASHPIEDYLGDYEHPAYGIYHLRQDDKGLVMTFNTIDKVEARLEHYHYDIFNAKIERFDEDYKLSFETDLKGNVRRFKVQIEPAVGEVTFTRLPDSRLSDPAILAQFTGEYDLLDLPLVIRLAGDKLVASLPGQENELEPYQGMEFTLKDRAGFSIRFQADKSGAYSQAVITQPGAVFTAVRKSKFEPSEE